MYYYVSFTNQLNPRLATRRPVSAHERLALCNENPKRCALLVDRIWVPCWCTDSESENIPSEFTFGDPEVDQDLANRTWYLPDIDIPWKDYHRGDFQEFDRKHTDIYVLDPLRSYSKRFPRTSIVPVDYRRPIALMPSGKDLVYEAVLEHVPVVLEEDLTWDQVRDFRKDEDARRKYRDLHLWIDQALTASSDHQRVDLIGQKLDDYRWAIRKHGLRSKLAGVAAFVTAASVGLPAGGIVEQAAHMHPNAAVIAGSALVFASSMAWVAQLLVDLRDVHRADHREVAYLHDVQQLQR